MLIDDTECSDFELYDEFTPVYPWLKTIFSEFLPKILISEYLQSDCASNNFQIHFLKDFC